MNKAVEQHTKSLKAITESLNKVNDYESKHNPKYEHPGNNIESYTELMNLLIEGLESGAGIELKIHGIKEKSFLP